MALTSQRAWQFSLQKRPQPLLRQKGSLAVSPQLPASREAGGITVRSLARSPTGPPARLAAPRTAASLANGNTRAALAPGLVPRAEPEEMTTETPGQDGGAARPPTRVKPNLDAFGYVGIDAVLEQMRRKAMKQGFEFNIMVVGQSGLGKSTLVNTLFKSPVSRKSCTPNHEEKIPKTVEIKSVSHVIEEKGVKMKLTVIDTPGFGDQINNNNCWEPVLKYINDQYEKYLAEEVNITRKKIIPDSRVHCCIYFIPATGHSLRLLDIEFMKRLGKVVNIVPVIAKSDTLTLEERQAFKKKIREQLETQGISIYPHKEHDEDEEDRSANNKIRELMPFAVVGSDKDYLVNGRKMLGRKTKWGIIEVENVAHCEFSQLRELLIRSHTQDLKEVTSCVHYEGYRVLRLSEGGKDVASVNGLAAKEQLA
ncbi:neuronal-specific septin-3-like isoform X3 [Lethenteron reissneri]|uniref:neuronal-specific septin-3-like isoform X3 n=1 Tax=Lethenteron reissneri TaxID=7753 RepID=UPI002AB6470C|nr:neuronal-specific septin-3-like isoform X3 [Lethenteron reissneri]